VVLLVGAEFRQLLSDCVSELNNASHSDVVLTVDSTTAQCRVPSDTAQCRVPSDTAQCRVPSDCVLDSHADNASDIVTVVNTSCLVSSVESESVSGDTAVDEEDEAVCTDDTECRGQTVTVSCPVWTTFLQHYVKLGETHAYICGFTKNR